MGRRIAAFAQLAGALIALMIVKLVKKLDEKSLIAFVAVGVVPLAFILIGIFGLWAGAQWGLFAATIVVMAGLAAAAMLVVSAGQLIRAEAMERRKL